MDAQFLDLVLWILLPLVVLFILWAFVDCLRSPTSRKHRLYYGLLILLLPVWGAHLWLRSKAASHSSESDLMRRVRERRDRGKR